MELLKSILPDFSQVFQIAYLFIFKFYGWVFFVFGLIAMLWHLYRHEIEHQYIDSQNWIFLHLKVPRENMASMLGIESIFAQMHSLHAGKTFYDKYVEGHLQLWYSLEIISMGGKISYIIRIPERMKDTVEAAFYSQYPQAEITKVDDYMEGFHFNPYAESEYDLFGSEWKLTDSDVIPIKTYKDFEHPAAEEPVLDPLANFFEALSNIQPYEFIGFQINIQPLSDEEWKPKAERKVKELIEEEIPHKFSLIDFLLTPFDWFASLGRGAHGSGHNQGSDENKPRNKWMNMTEAEKERVNRIEKKIGKPGYKTKIRMLYIAPKDKLDNSKKALLSGVYRPFGSLMSNKLKPDLAKTWAGVDPVISKTFEKNFMDSKLKKRKLNIFKGYKKRSILIGSPMFILATDEIATLFHFPITTKTTFAPSSVEKTETKKSQPPANLPVAES